MTDKKGVKSIVNIGDTVSFVRKGRVHNGTVYKINENSVLVAISNESKKLLGYENNNTVVSHKNYLITKRAKIG